MQIKLNSKVMVSDPCYGLNTWCQGVIEGVLPGNYNCKAKLINKTYWGERVAAIEVCHEDYKSPKYIPALLDIGVDSGQAGIFDYEYYKKYHTDASDYDHVESQWYDEVCKLTLSPKQCGTIGDKGFVSSSGYGDGSYECYVAKNNNDEIIAIRIDFIKK